MFQTLAVYLLLAGGMLSLTRLGVASRKWGWLFFGGAMLLFCAVLGMRYGVGTDHLRYLRYYRQESLVWSEFEPGFRLIQNLFYACSIHYAFYFAFLAFLQIFFVFLALRKNREVLPYVVFTLIFGGVFLRWANSIRQDIAFALMMFALGFILRKQMLMYLITIAAACLFHISAIILFPLYFIFRYKGSWFNRLRLQFGAFAATLLLGFLNLENKILPLLFALAERLQLKYAFYQDFKEELLSASYDRGIGWWVNLAVCLLLIGLSPKVKEYFKNTTFPYMYDLWFIGVLYKNLFFASQTLLRFNLYFIAFQFVVAAFTLYYLSRSEPQLGLKANLKKLWLFLLLTTLYLLTFAALMYKADENTARYIFFWQEHLFDYKEALLSPLPRGRNPIC